MIFLCIYLLSESFYTNPQYKINVTDVDDDDDEEIGTVIIGLMQKGRRKLKSGGFGNFTISYEIYEVCIPAILVGKSEICCIVYNLLPVIVWETGGFVESLFSTDIAYIRLYIKKIEQCFLI